jgi:hypothetical protein
MFHCHTTTKHSTPLYKLENVFSILHMPIKNTVRVYIAKHVRREEDVYPL